MFDEVAEDLRSKIKGKVSRSIAIARFTSYRVGGKAEIFVQPEDEADLDVLYETSREFSVSFLVLGRGTNVLVSDQGFPGIVLRLSRGFGWAEIAGEVVSAGGAVALPQLANRSARRSLSGLEFSVAIPATVGGAVRMNAGAHGLSVSDVLKSARVFDLSRGNFRESDAAGLQMSYRHTNLRSHDVVVSASFSLTSRDASSIKGAMEDYRAHRAATQPTEAPNAGSMFQNPQDLSAGYLIESCGLKGRRVGRAEVSTKHANFFLAHSGATSQDVFDLLALVQESVEESKGVLLKPEVRIVGRFQREEKLRR